MNYTLSICLLFLSVVIFFDLVSANSRVCYNCFNNSTCAENPLNTAKISLADCYSSSGPNQNYVCITVTGKLNLYEGMSTYRSCAPKIYNDKPICNSINDETISQFLPGTTGTDISCSSCESNMCNSAPHKSIPIIAIVLSYVSIMILTR
ncbi:uncharacterized protein [Euwallacea similis]|uniref:uncharacterized protein n=1 Tax=Euwallacea similis TaxID=1736056 RepID=UPI00344BE124